jgi:hypothetical protein
MIPVPARWPTLIGETDAGRNAVNGWLLWGLILPILLIVAGTVTLLRRRNSRR